MAWFTAQIAAFIRLADSRLALVNAGCDRVLGTQISTNLVRPPQAFPIALSGVLRRLRKRPANAGQIRICIYARYSTEEQHESSIDDQIRYCKRCLESQGIDLSKAVIETFADREVSGETVFRPGIDRVREGVLNESWDILICEDVSRLFRNVSACHDLVEEAVDNGIRVVAINDHVDSNDKDWYDRFCDAALHHAKTNRYTSHRIKRKHESLWESGAAIGMVKTGYRRIQPKVDELKIGQRTKDPKFDEIDPEWNETIKKMYEKVATGVGPDEVAEWLTEQGLPKCASAKTEKWFKRDVIAKVRNPIYRGVETFRSTQSERKFRSGKRKQKRSDQQDILSRDMSHLRIVEDWLWEKANAKIDERMVKNTSSSGDGHPLSNIPRNSRSPLSELFVCGICGAKMWGDGRNEGGYRCGRARSGDCWNKATALRGLVHERISKLAVDQLLSIEGVQDILVEHINKVSGDDEVRRLEEKKLLSEIDKLKRECSHLGDVIAAQAGGDTLFTLVEKLKERETLITLADAKLGNIRFNLASPPMVTVDQIREQIEKCSNKLLDLDRNSGRLLSRLVDGKIQAVPYLQFQSTKVVLRADFVIRPVGILPEELAAALTGKELETVAALLPAQRIIVDLFNVSTAPEYAIAVRKLKEQDARLTLVEIGEALGISKSGARDALKLGRKMQAAGIDDPFIRLSQRPAKVARWK